MKLHLVMTLLWVCCAVAAAEDAAVDSDGSVVVQHQQNKVPAVPAAEPATSMVLPLPGDIEGAVERCELFSKAERQELDMLASSTQPEWCSELPGGHQQTVAMLGLGRERGVFRWGTCEAYQSRDKKKEGGELCQNFVPEVLVYHAAHVFGFQDKIPPTVFRELDKEWFAEACNHTLGGDGQVLGSLQLFWNDVYMKYGVIQQYNPDNYPDWIERANDRGTVLTPFEAHLWSELSDILLFDHIVDNDDRSGFGVTLRSNGHWLMPSTKNPTEARLVWLDHSMCMATQYKPGEADRLMGLCRFRRSTVTRLRALRGRFGELTRRSVLACDPLHRNVPLLSTQSAENTEAWAALDARLDSALEWIEGCEQRFGVEMVQSLL